MTPPQLFAWRRTYRAEAEKAASFVPVVVTAEPEYRPGQGLVGCGVRL
ncbi:hypothetical protein [Chenggangzhangella methanolivorans]